MVIARAPLRISFGGGGTDLAAYYTRFGGLVISAAISRYCHVTLRPSAHGGVQITSADYQIWDAFPAGAVPVVQEPLALPKAVIEWFAERSPRALSSDVFLASEVPPGTGLGSSSAMTVALLRTLAAHCEIPMTAGDVAEVASWIEIDRLGMPIGKQDQYASAFGGLNSIEFTPNGVHVAPLNLASDVVAKLQQRLLLFSTGQTHNSTEILRQQRSDTMSKPLVIESLHQIKAIAVDMRAALIAGNLDQFGHLLDYAWQVKKSLSKKISSSAIDAWYATARQAGAEGGKITGAGGGGFLLLYCSPRKQKAVRAALAQCGLREMTFAFDFAGAQVMTEVSAAPDHLAVIA